MDAFLQQFQHLKIQLEEIISATNNFNVQKNCIGVGGFGKVYKGEVSHFKGRSMAAIKRLDPKHGQGTPEFLKEITMLSGYRHENLTSLLGFCCQGSEMILVYELASRGSLDRYLNSPHLAWTQRLKICIDAAKGLSYLHDPRETHQRLIHCDIKSSNILLDDQWNAKISDFGLSIMGPANEQHSVIVTNAAGTLGYCDPQYAMTHTLTKESDVYSFGVVLFEVLCGRLCCTYSNGRVQEKLVPTWVESYKQKKLNDIIFKSATIQPLDPIALEMFSDIGFRCLKESRVDRPTMGEVVIELETALACQEFSERGALFDYEELIETVEPPLNYSSKGELWKILSKGILLNGGKTWFSINKKGEHSEMISFAECLVLAPSDSESDYNSENDSDHDSEDDCDYDEYNSEYKSRFVVGPYRYCGWRESLGEVRVKTQFLSPGITYTVNLVFKFPRGNKARICECISLEYKLQGDTKSSISYLAFKREDGWWMVELFQFTSDQKIVDLVILFHHFNPLHIYAEGIEFQPVEQVECKDENRTISDSYANWEQKLPTDYEDIIKWSKDSLQWTTKKEAYSIIFKGFLIDDGKKWFSLDKNGKKCHIASAAYHWRVPSCVSLPESRFGEAVELSSAAIEINIRIMSQLVSSQTTYACYLVYKLPKDQSGLQALLKVEDKNKEFLRSGDDIWYIYLESPKTPVIRPKANQNTHNPLNKPKMKGLPRRRNDDWMEVQIWEFQTATTTEMINMNLDLTHWGRSKQICMVLIEGVEFRPV